MKATKILAGAFIAAVMLTGCMTEEIVKGKATDVRIEMINNDNFELSLLSSKAIINDDGLLEVDAKAVISRTSTLRWMWSCDPQIKIWYHYDWIDAKGNIFISKQKILNSLPGSIVDFHAIAPAEKYISFHLTLSLKGPETKEEAAAQQKKTTEQYKNRKVQNVQPAAVPTVNKVLTPSVPAPEPAAKPAEKKPETKPAAKPVEKKPETKTVTEPAAKPAEKKPETKTVTEPAAKPAEKKPEAKPAAKPVEKKPETKTVTEPAAKPVEKKPETKTVTEPAAKPVEKKPETEPVAKPAEKKQSKLTESYE